MPLAMIAFSGGLDTSYCVVYLQDKGYDVMTVTVDTGGFSNEELVEIEARSKELGALKHITVDAKDLLYNNVVSYIIRGNILRGGVYPLSAGPERVIQASEAARVAADEGADVVVHGSTGAGNDQIRFDLAVRVIAPNVDVLAPIRELGLTRDEEADFLRSKGYEVDASTQLYSINQGLLGTTIGGKETKNAWESVPDDVFPSVKPIDQTPDEALVFTLTFERGLPVKLNDESLSGIDIVKTLTQWGADYGFGKDYHLGDTILGIKGRIAFEAPGPLIVIKAHKELEKLTLTKSQSFWKNHLADVYGNSLHEGLYFDPVMRDIEAMIESSQQTVTGEVRVTLHKGNCIIDGANSEFSLLNTSVATYGEENAMWSGRDAQGFAKIYGLQGVLASYVRKQQSLPTT